MRNTYLERSRASNHRPSLLRLTALAMAAFTATALVVTSTNAAPAEPSKAPNIVLIITDDVE